MKKIKNIIFYSLFSIALILGVTNVEAKSYTSYNAGDKITVKVNDNTNLDFYVMEDSDDKVTAIYEDVLGDIFAFGASESGYDESDAQTKLNELTSTWNNVAEKRLIKANEIISGATLSSTYSEEFTTPSYLCNGKNYWILDTHKDSNTGNIIPFAVESWVTQCTLNSYTDGSGVNTKSYIRPVITVSKENVVGGITVTEDDKIWENFVNEFKKTSVIEYLEDAGNTINITSTDNTLKIEMSDGTNNWTTNFTYANGILTYVPSISDENKLIDSIWVGNTMTTLAGIKGYDGEKLSAWLESKNDFDLIKDGIEFVETKIDINESESGVDFSMSSTVFSSFKLDIKNGLKTFKSESGSENSNEQNEVVKNPKTGLFTGVGVAGTVGVLSFGAYLILKKKNVFPNA